MKKYEVYDQRKTQLFMEQNEIYDKNMKVGINYPTVIEISKAIDKTIFCSVGKAYKFVASWIIEGM